MRLIPLITAVLVSVILYFAVIDRDALLGFAGADGADVDAAAIVTTADEAQTAALIRVVAVHSQARDVDSAVVLRGRTEASRSVEMRAETAGQVISEPLRKGAMVAAGDLLCDIDPGTRMSALQEARARLIEAEARLPEAAARVPAARAQLTEAGARVSEATARLAEAQARLTEATLNQTAAQRLSEGGFASDTRVAGADAALESARAGVSSAEAAVQGVSAQVITAEAGIEGALAAVESARAGIFSAEAAVASANREIERLRITAPFAGLLETDAAELGSLLQPGSVCATVIQLDPIKLIGFAPETDVGKLSVGARAGARLTSGAQLVGVVTYLSRSADEATRTFRVEVEVPNPDLAIRDGETAEILVATEGRRAHLLAQSTLTLDDTGRLGVRTIDADGTALFMPVTLLRDTVDGVWVADLPDTVDVIVVGQEYVVDGVAVEPTWREPGRSEASP